MRARVQIIVATAALLATPGLAAAQRLPPLPPPVVVLTVPHPIPPVPSSPEPPLDLFQQPTPAAHPPHVPRTIVIYPYVYGPSLYLPGGYGYMSSVDTPRSFVMPPAQRGGLIFETAPGSAQVFVDGYYVGVIDDFGMSGRALDLDGGPHRFELRAPGYATLAFDVNIVANRTVRYRGDLQRLAPAAPPAPATASAARKTTYVIPNCYAGDRPPTRALPRGCDITLLQTRN